MYATLIALATAALLGAPEIDEVAPSPITLGGVAEILGRGFVAGATSVTVGGVAQSVANVQPDRVRIVVTEDTPLGPQPLVVTTADGSDSLSVEVALPAPVIFAVAPDPLVVGASASVTGEHLDRVTAVSVGGVNAPITLTTATLVAFTVPLDPALLGTRQLVLASPSGATGKTVTVVAPVPSVSAIAPNPARIGDLVTIRGALLPQGVSVSLGFTDAPVVLATPGAVTVHVPEAAALGPQDVIVRVGQVSSPPEGPLYLQAGDPDRPEVTGTYPVNVARGGAAWIVGTNLDAITAASHGLAIIACDKRTCRLDTSGAPVGEPLNAAVSGPHGASVFKLQVTDEALIVPTVTEVEPSPALRGQLLTVRGTNLQRTRAAVIGGRSQSITFFDTTTVSFTVHPDTPLGAQPLFIAGTGGSEAFTVTVLDPVATPDADPDVVEPDATAGDTAPPPRPPDDGCRSGGSGRHESAWALWAAVALIACRRRPWRAWRLPRPWPPSA